MTDPVDWPTVTRWHLAADAAAALDALRGYLNPDDAWDGQWDDQLDRASDTVATILADTRRRLEGTP